MLSQCELNITISDVIATLAFLISALSALYARWSWKESKKANLISLREDKVQIYDAFFALKMHMTQKAEFADKAEVTKFFYYSLNAKKYLPNDLSNDVEKYFETCFWIADTHRRDGGLSSENKVKFDSLLKTERILAPQIDTTLLKLIQEASNP